MKALYLVAAGEVDAAAMDWIESAVARRYPFSLMRLPGLALPEGAYDAARQQYQSVEIMKALAGAIPPGAVRLLGVTEVDISIPVLTFLFGQAQIDGAVALVSLCRLRQEFYGFPRDEEVLRTRAVKEALHELGHTFGLTHCSDPGCVMSLAPHIALVDRKGQDYCRACAGLLERRMDAWKGEAA